MLVSGGLLLVLAVGLWHFRRETVRLRSLLGEATSRLQRLQVSFTHFAPPDIVERIIEGGLPTKGEKLEVTVLFADLVGFTALAESLEPSKLVEIINGYFDRMSGAITEHRGHVDAFIGDGLLALFGAFEPNPWQGNDSVRAALAMRAELAAYNRELEDKGLPTLGVGIGLHRGTGIAGLVGSRDKKEFTIMGRPINIAARVQALTREYGVDILATDDLRRTLDPDIAVDEIGPVTLRVIQEPITVYAIKEFAENTPD